MARWDKKVDQMCKLCKKPLYPNANNRDKALGKKVYHKKCFRKHELVRHKKNYVPNTNRVVKVR